MYDGIWQEHVGVNAPGIPTMTILPGMLSMSTLATLLQTTSASDASSYFKMLDFAYGECL